ncbi:SDR family oxidoreductase [Saccharicrinis sp. GN24d3]|uniref:SDR family oxidoreductase n=1 Tax=Saccharicrinis sp. GN24d3 TaxID=3458416 RepID=UPI004035EE4B
MNKKTILITGCSSGFGKLTAKLFHKNGWNVIATMRSPEKETELTALSDVLVTKLDVTDQISVSKAVDAGVDKFGGIDVLVNNAGFSGAGIFEQWKDGDIKAMFETNVFGLMRVTKEVLPLMRSKEEGIIINISSLAGLIGSPSSSVYSASKFAVEGLTEALAIEYAPFNIKFKTIAPGAYETNLYSSMDNSRFSNGDEQLRDYCLKMIAKMNETVEQMIEQGNQTSDPQEVADKIYKCATEKTPIHNVSGIDAESMLQMKKSMSEEELVKTISDMVVPNTSNSNPKKK